MFIFLSKDEIDYSTKTGRIAKPVLSIPAAQPKHPTSPSTLLKV
jgi:hypothetical protein